MPVLDETLQHYLRWSTIEEWSNLRGNWNKIEIAVGAIDGASHEIYRPSEYQEQFYCGYRCYHCMHTKVVIDNIGMVRYIETGFLGHQNNAQHFMLMQQIGQQLPCLADCILLRDRIYPNSFPVVTPFSNAQLRRKAGDASRRARRLSRYITLQDSG